MSYQTEIVRYFVEHPGQHVFLQTICDLTGQSDGHAMASVGHVMNTNKLPGLVRVGKGGPWMYRPNTVTSGAGSELFELLARTKSGTMILQGTDGKLYRAEELS